MALPPYYDLRTAALRLIGDGRVHRIRDVIDGIAGELDVGRADRALLTPKMRRRKFDIDVESAVADLRRAAWLENTALGRFRITAEGRAILGKGPKRIDARFLRNNSAAFRKSLSIRSGSGRERTAESPAAGGREFDGIAAVIGIPAAWGSGAGDAREAIGDKPLRLMRYVRNLLEAEKALGGLVTAAFSGTMFITAEGAARTDLLLAFGRAVWPAVVRGIREDVQVCGCVAGGRLVRTAENWVGGSAAREAVAHSDMPRWVGISAAPSANGMLAAAMPLGAHRDGGGGGAPYVRHGLPIGVTAEQGAWAVDWPGLCDREEGGREVEELVGIIDDRLDTTPDIGASVRWWNTRRFCENALAAP